MDLLIRELGLVEYTCSWHAMQQFTGNRSPETVDEIWLLQHPSVFTQGQAGKAEHVLAPGDIPVIQADRGGQVTYHGPGQLVGYLLIDVRRKKIGVRQLVSDIENSLVDTLMEWNIESAPRPDAPGVYTQSKKIASLGLRIRNGCSFHGLALNVDMDLEPFNRINPCGYQGLEMTQVKDFYENPNMNQISQRLAHYLQKNLGYNDAKHTTEAWSAV